MAWLVRLILDGPDGERVSSLLWDAGTTGIAEEGDLLLAGFDDRAAAEAVATRAAADRWPARVLAIEPIEWRGTDERTTVAVRAPDGRSVALSIVAGPTFGHGGHPTTALALELLAETVAPGDRVLDAGTGSGVLAIAAAGLGAGAAIGIDIDPAVVPVAEANARANGVEVGVHVLPIPAAAALVPGRRFDVVVANLLVPGQRELGADLTRVLAPGGSLIVSGYLAADGDEVAGRYRSLLAGDPTVTVRRRDGWLAHRFELRNRPR